MSRHTQTIEHLERSAEDNGLTRALAARPDRAFKRACINSAQSAKWLGVGESDVQFWRRGFTVASMNDFARIAAVRNLDIH
jgi:hypothetical protein